MTKVRLHPTLIELHGAMKDMCFRQVNGQMYVSVKSNGPSGEPTAAQMAHRERFGLAVAYAKFALADPESREVYDAASAQKGIPPFALGVADYLNAPSVAEIDTAAYTGQIGSTLAIMTQDDLGVKQVNVVLTNAQGDPVESGLAVENSAGSGHWTYTAKSLVAAGTTVNIQVTATDRPGGTGVKTATKAL
ncbi:MAG TPA: hypothetical protein VK249_16190 [Anaerolineales bacterium]|nr:hypothetical protein [Anaerolineales bacterium]